MSSQSRLLKTGGVLLRWFVLPTILMAFIGWLIVSIGTNSIASAGFTFSTLMDFFVANDMALTLIRWSVITTVLIAWPVDFISRLFGLQQTTQELLYEERAKLSIIIVVLELFVNTNILGYL